MPNKTNLIPYVEGVKEGLRTFVLAVIPVTIDGLLAEQINWRAILIVGVVATLRFIDKTLHQTNKNLPAKDQNDGLLGKKGLTGF